jgi:hypothetical protein
MLASFTLQWTAVPGAAYRVQYKSALEAATWNDLPGEVMATLSSATKSDVIQTAGQRFYRVVAIP